ncbi:phosphoglycolate phosphatase [Halobacteriales archaeon QS_8_69_73]|nr:MAG: phosphoglycolate phosphatase [Halobacteriales archaeon QS_8_69_73]
MVSGNHDDHETLVFDLDGTLVRLAVDWDEAAEAVAAVLESRGVSPSGDLWTMLETADRTGHREAVETVLADRERDGARNSERLPAADTVPGGAGVNTDTNTGIDAGVDADVGVCSLNCEAACRVALEVHDIGGVDAVVGRDTVETEKPDPEPLLETVRRLGGDPAETLFVGDSERDEVTAERAGIDYVYVSEWLRA